jgi:citrate synthase
MAAPAEIAPDTGRIESAVCHLDADRGRLTYRGYDVNELAEHATFEQVAYLLVAGALPTPVELKVFRRAWTAAQKLSAAERRWLRSVRLDADELTVLRTVVSGLSLAGAAAAPASDALAGISPEALRLLARVPAFSAERQRLRRGGTPVPGWGRQGVAHGYLRVATGVEPPVELVRALDAALILRADNELNPGTYAARIAASTGADLTSCVTAAMGALAGPKHSGHTLAVARLLAEVGATDRADGVVEKLALAGKKPAGFGHPVYRGEDPRTPTARRLAEIACGATGAMATYDLARAVEAAVGSRTGLRANVDYYLTVVYLAAGFPAAAFAPLFAMARTPGWIAHALEQSRDPDLIRPRARYTGPEEQHLPPVAREDHGLRIPRRHR